MRLINTDLVSQEIRLKAWELSESSFPLCERRPHSEHLRALQDPAFHADIIMDDELFIGIIFYWIYDEKYLYVEHLATDSSLRSKGYGNRAMELLLNMGYVTILEIDPPIDEISIRRRGFYERLGFAMSDHRHIHPSYRSQTEPHELKMMSFPYRISDQEFERFRDYLLHNVMIYSSDYESRIK